MCMTTVVHGAVCWQDNPLVLSCTSRVSLRGSCTLKGLFTGSQVVLSYQATLVTDSKVPVNASEPY